MYNAHILKWICYFEEIFFTGWPESCWKDNFPCIFYWVAWKLSKGQLSVHPVMKIVSKLHFGFSVWWGFIEPCLCKPHFMREVHVHQMSCLVTGLLMLLWPDWYLGINNHFHDDVIKTTFPCYWPFVQGIHRSPVNSPHKGQWHRVFMFSLVCSWINGGVNNSEAGDLRRHHTYYDFNVMLMITILTSQIDSKAWWDLNYMLRHMGLKNWYSETRHMGLKNWYSVTFSTPASAGGVYGNNLIIILYLSQTDKSEGKIIE